jgi:hypothetical protein
MFHNSAAKQTLGVLYTASETLHCCLVTAWSVLYYYYPASEHLDLMPPGIRFRWGRMRQKLGGGIDASNAIALAAEGWTSTTKSCVNSTLQG